MLAGPPKGGLFVGRVAGVARGAISNAGLTRSGARENQNFNSGVHNQRAERARLKGIGSLRIRIINLSCWVGTQDREAGKTTNEIQRTSLQSSAELAVGALPFRRGSLE